jgi:hypothetical protein
MPKTPSVQNCIYICIYIYMYIYIYVYIYICVPGHDNSSKNVAILIKFGIKVLSSIYLDKFENQADRSIRKGVLGGFCTPKMGFFKFLRIIYLKFKFLFSPLDLARKNKQFSNLNFCSKSISYRDIQSAKHSTLSQC